MTSYTLVAYFDPNTVLDTDLPDTFPGFQVATCLDLPDRVTATARSTRFRDHYSQALFSYGAHTVNITRERG